MSGQRWAKVGLTALASAIAILAALIVVAVGCVQSNQTSPTVSSSPAEPRQPTAVILQKAPAIPTMVPPVAGLVTNGVTKGSPDAKVVLTEWSDFQ